jgi:AbrB family looped-hinge helix DNA binding protein
MAITIDSAGRVVIPQSVRRHLGLVGGTRLSVEEIDGGVVLRPVSKTAIEIADDGLPVIRSRESEPAMTRDDVRQLIEDSREWPSRY